MDTILDTLVLSTFFVTYLRETDPAVVEVRASAEYRDCVSHLSKFTTSLLSPEEHFEPYCFDYHYGHRPDLAATALLAAIYRSDLRHHRPGLAGPGRPPGGQQDRHGLGRYNYCEDHLTAHATSLVSPAKIIVYCFEYHFGWIPGRETGAALKAAYTGPLSDAEFQQGFLTPPPGP